MSQQYTHLHNHTSASFFDGAQTPIDFARRVDQLGMGAAAITDHGVCHGWPKFQVACDEVGIEPILGVEAYLVEDRDEITRLRQKTKATRDDWEQARLKTQYHQVLLAKTQEGLQNLMKLMSWAADEGFYSNPLIDFDKMDEHSEGIIATSSCVSGIVPQIALGNGPFSVLSKEEKKQKIFEVTERYLDIFGDDFYLEAHNHGYEDEEMMREIVQYLSGKYDISVVTANDCHYGQEEDYWTQKIRTAISTSYGGDTTFFDSDQVEKYTSPGLHVRPGDEMVDLMPEFPDAAQNTMEVRSKCDARLPMEDGEYFFPEYPEIGEAETAHQRLKRECGRGFKMRYPNPTGEHKERMRYELGVIKDMGFSNYFLIVADMVQYARKQGIKVGPGRGSAAGSMVTYVLGITGLDPLKHGLLFDRFLNVERVTMPDIDIDFDDERREEVLDYLREKYGKESVAQVVTFTNFKSKNAIKKAGKSFRLSISEVDSINDTIGDEPWVRSMTIDELMEDERVHGLREMEQEDDRIAKAFDAARELYGMEFTDGKHPAAAVVAPGQITDYVPTMQDTNDDGEPITKTQFDGDQLEDLGLLKIDVLGLKTLRTIRLANDIVEQRTGSRVPEETLNARDDQEVYDKTFAEGDTLGVFQFTSSGMIDFLSDMKPREFGHITAAVSLYRPGPMKLIPDFIARMHGDQRTVYLDESIHDTIEDDVADILDDTHGIMVYQEQVMQICQRLAGFSLGDADIMRRAIGKKKEKLLMQQREKFIEGCMEEGYGRELGETVFDLFEDFADYAFNKSHAAAYAAVAYQQAYFKAHHPVAFFTAALQTESSENKQVKLMQDAEDHGIDVLPPSVNESGQQFTAIPGKDQIRFGLSTVKNVGKQAQVIIDERQNSGPYDSFMDLAMRAKPNLGAVKGLIKTGGMDDFDLTRRAMYEQKDDIYSYVSKMRDYRSGDRVSKPDPPSVENKAEWPPKMRYQQERDMAGIYTTGQPAERFPTLIDGFDDQSHRKRSKRYGDSDFIVRCGSILSVKEKFYEDKHGVEQSLWIIDYISQDGLKDNVVFGSRFEEIKGNVEKDTPVVIVASADVEGEYAGQPVIKNVMPMRRIPSKWAQVLRVEVPTKEKAKEVFRYFDRLPSGDTEIWVSVPAGNGASAPEDAPLETAMMDKRMQLDLESYLEALSFGEVTIY